MGINKWPAIAAIAILVAGSAAADSERTQKKAQAQGKTTVEKRQRSGPSAETRAREEVNERTREKADVQGAQKSREMQERREERKEIKAEYGEARKAGEAKQTGKKPWWKFWESDEDS